MFKKRFPAVLKRKGNFQYIKLLAKMPYSLKTKNTKRFLRENVIMIKNIYTDAYFFADLPLLVFGCGSALTACMASPFWPVDSSVVTSATFAPRLALLAG